MNSYLGKMKACMCSFKPEFNTQTKISHMRSLRKMKSISERTYKWWWAIKHRSSLSIACRRSRSCKVGQRESLSIALPDLCWHGSKFIIREAGDLLLSISTQNLQLVCYVWDSAGKRWPKNGTSDLPEDWISAFELLTYTSEATTADK